MKLLLDNCMSFITANRLRAAGHDVIWVGDWPHDPGDPAILERAYGEGRVLLTLDKDFGELVVGLGLPHAGIIRLVEIPPEAHAHVIADVIANYARDLAEASIVTVDQKRTRVRPADEPDGL